MYIVVYKRIYVHKYTQRLIERTLNVSPPLLVQKEAHPSPIASSGLFTGSR